MALDCTAHLRSWIISEVENQLEAAGERTQRWAADLVTALLAPLALPELFIAAAEILTLRNFCFSACETTLLNQLPR